MIYFSFNLIFAINTNYIIIDNSFIRDVQQTIGCWKRREGCGYWVEIEIYEIDKSKDCF